MARLVFATFLSEKVFCNLIQKHNCYLISLLFTVGEKAPVDNIDNVSAAIGESTTENDEELPREKRRKIDSKLLSKVKIDREMRFDGEKHWVLFDDKKSGTRCKYNNCNKTIFSYCSKCKVYLCNMRGRNCFFEYHNRDIESGEPSA